MEVVVVEVKVIKVKIKYKLRKEVSNDQPRNNSERSKKFGMENNEGCG